MTRAIYYPRIKNISFYDPYGNLTGGIYGSHAKSKFWRMIKAFTFPRVSFRKKIKMFV